MILIITVSKMKIADSLFIYYQKGGDMHRLYIFIVILISAVSISPQNAASSHISKTQNIDFDMMVEETQIFSNNPDKMIMVWWIPNEYWLAIAEDDPLFDISLAEETVETLNPYIVTFVLMGKVGSFGGVKYESVESIYSNCKLMLSNHHMLSPIERSNIEPDVKNFMDMMKPMFANMMGAMGENMHYVLFNAKYQNGDFYINSRDKDHFMVNVLDERLKFNLPLASLFPKKTCPECGEILNGLYSYCPFDGIELQ
jgi:hypothetical protein